MRTLTATQRIANYRKFKSYNQSEEADLQKENEDWINQSTEIGRKIQAALKDSGKNIYWLADQLGTSFDTVNEMRNGSYDFKLSEIAQISKILDTNLWNG